MCVCVCVFTLNHHEFLSRLKGEYRFSLFPRQFLYQKPSFLYYTLIAEVSEKVRIYAFPTGV